MSCYSSRLELAPEYIGAKYHEFGTSKFAAGQTVFGVISF